MVSRGSGPPQQWLPSCLENRPPGGGIHIIRSLEQDPSILGLVLVLVCINGREHRDSVYIGSRFCTPELLSGPVIAFAESQRLFEAGQQSNQGDLVLGFICIDYLKKVGVLIDCVSTAQTSVSG